MRHPVLAAVALCMFSLAAHADPVTYTLSGYFSGTIGSTPFTNTLLVFSMTGDTSNVTTLPGGTYYINTVGESTVTLDGIGTAIFTHPAFGVESQYNDFGRPDSASFYDNDNSWAVTVLDSAFNGYNLTAPFGPITGEAVDNRLGSEPTSLGSLVILGETGNATFQATAATPEPSSFALLGTGLLGVVGLVRKRFA